MTRWQGCVGGGAWPSGTTLVLESGPVAASAFVAGLCSWGGSNLGAWERKDGGSGMQERTTGCGGHNEQARARGSGAWLGRAGADGRRQKGTSGATGGGGMENWMRWEREREKGEEKPRHGFLKSNKNVG